MARISLQTHWKFQRLARAVGSKVLARGILETLWEPCWVAGDAYCGTRQDIEALCEWKGEPGALTKALLMEGAKGAGFIETYDGRVKSDERHYQIHDFYDHCPEYVRRRRERELHPTSTKRCVLCGDEYPTSRATSRCMPDRCRQAARRDKSDRDPCHRSDRDPTEIRTVTNDRDPQPRSDRDPLISVTTDEGAASPDSPDPCMTEIRPRTTGEPRSDRDRDLGRAVTGSADLGQKVPLSRQVSRQPTGMSRMSRVLTVRCSVPCTTQCTK